jgi:hypothetical protein
MNKTTLLGEDPGNLKAMKSETHEPKFSGSEKDII